MKDYFSYKPVIRLQDAQTLRSIRNMVRDNMTNNRAFITDQDQVRWFYTIGKSIKAYLVYNYYHACIGYGMLSRRTIGIDEERWWGSIAVVPEFQRQGYGTGIYRLLRKIGFEYCDDVYLEIFSDNIGSLRAATKADYVVVWANDKTITMKGYTTNDTIV